MPVHVLRDVRLDSGQTLPEVPLAYRVYGTLNDRRDNLVVFPTYFTGRAHSNAPFFGPGRALDPARHCILVPCLIGNGESLSPSNAPPALSAAAFPRITLRDNVRLQRALVDALFGVERIALVIGWSMGGCQAYEWALQEPHRVERLLPFCASARCSPTNRVFLEGVRAALRADAAWDGDTLTSVPERGLRAFGRVYAGWAYSAAFFDGAEYRALGFETLEALLDDWEADHLSWDARDLLCKLDTWARADISRNPVHDGDLDAALAAIPARAILMPCTTDAYFTPDLAQAEAARMPRAECRPFASVWGHCAATPGRPAPGFMEFLDTAIRDLELA